MAHCRHELIQAVWKYMLDNDFVHAMVYGVVVTCYDGIKWRIYPWIFTYSADYPEKYLTLLLISPALTSSFRVLLATVRDNGLCPCPRCLMLKMKLDQMGNCWDISFRVREVRWYLSDAVQQARKVIYQLGHAVAGTGVNGMLKSTSSVPVVVSTFLGRRSTVSDCQTERVL